MTTAITRVELKNFLVFKGNFSADFCPGINVIIGENGSGKTTLLKSMYRLCGSNKHFCTEEYFFAANRLNTEFSSRPFEHLRLEIVNDKEIGRNGNLFTLIEAKRIAPNPRGEKGQRRFDEYIDEIKSKFADSTELLISHLLRFKNDTADEIPVAFFPSEKKAVKLKYYFIIKESREIWLIPIKNALTKALIRQKELLNAEIAVLTGNMAEKIGLIQRNVN